MRFVLDILCVTYFLTARTMPDPQTCDMHQLALATVKSV